MFKTFVILNFIEDYEIAHRFTYSNNMVENINFLKLCYVFKNNVLPLYCEDDHIKVRYLRRASSIRTEEFSRLYSEKFPKLVIEGVMIGVSIDIETMPNIRTYAEFCETWFTDNEFNRGGIPDHLQNADVIEEFLNEHKNKYISFSLFNDDEAFKNNEVYDKHYNKLNIEPYSFYDESCYGVEFSEFEETCNLDVSEDTVLKDFIDTFFPIFIKDKTINFWGDPLKDFFSELLYKYKFETNLDYWFSQMEKVYGKYSDDLTNFDDVQFWIEDEIEAWYNKKEKI